MKRVDYEPGLLAVFRVYVLARLAVSLLSLLAVEVWSSSRLQRLTPYPLLGVAESTFLLGYLSWPWLRARAGRAYLPVALAIATLAPVFELLLGVDMRLGDEVTAIGLLASQWQLVIFLLVPLILISWQYNFRVVIAYVLGLAVLDVVLALPWSRAGLLRLGPAFGVVALRTFIYLIAGYAITRLVAEQRAQNSRLAQANDQLSSYAGTLEQLAISRERNRLARELHDTLAHTLSAVAVQLEAVSSLWEGNPAAAREMLDRSLRTTRDGLGETRRAIQALRTTPLDDLGFALALSNLARSTAERNGLALDLDVPEEAPGLDPQAEHSLYRIAEEALRNVTQHAGARSLAVSLQQAGRRWTLTIRDDGRGFAAGLDLPNGHFGLRGMRERAEALGADLNVDSRPGCGTTVSLTLEVKNGAGVDL